MSKQLVRKSFKNSLVVVFRKRLKGHESLLSVCGEIQQVAPSRNIPFRKYVYIEGKNRQNNKTVQCKESLLTSYRQHTFFLMNTAPYLFFQKPHWHTIKSGRIKFQQNCCTYHVNTPMTLKIKMQHVSTLAKFNFRQNTW